MARSGFWLFADTATLDPPSSTGAVVPASEPGIAKKPMFASMSGQPSSGLMIWPGFQPGAGIMPTSPAQNAR